jgi:hypothetical protein
MESDDRFLTSLRYDAKFNLTFLDIEDGICDVSLRKNLPILSIIGYACPALYSGKEYVDVERFSGPRRGHVGYVSPVPMM